MFAALALKRAIAAPRSAAATTQTIVSAAPTLAKSVRSYAVRWPRRGLVLGNRLQSVEYLQNIPKLILSSI